MSNSKKREEEIENEAQWWKSEGKSGSLPSPKDYSDATVYSSSRGTATFPNPEYLSQKDMFSLRGQVRERREERNAQDAKPHADPAEAEADRRGLSAREAMENLARRKREGMKGEKMPDTAQMSRTERAIKDLLEENPSLELTSASHNIVNVNNGRVVFGDYNIFKDCRDIHFHIWPLGGGIRFRFEDGSEMQYNIGERNRDGLVLTKWRGEGAGNKNTDLILKQRPGQSSRSFVNYALGTIKRSRNYSDTTVKSAFMQYYNNRNILADFLELVERYVQVLISDTTYQARRRGGRKTRKYKKKNKRKTRRVRKSRKKLKSRKSRKKRKINKLRKSRRRSSIRR